MHSIIRTSIVLCCVVAACSSEQTNTPSPVATQAEPVQAQSEQLSQCVAIQEREKACTDEFIPALVDLRARLDMPPGIAAKAKADRAGLIAEALQEWKVDSADPKGFCQQQVAKTPPAKTAAFLPDAHACTTQSTCSAFVTCIIPKLQTVMAGR